MTYEEEIIFLQSIRNYCTTPLFTHPAHDDTALLRMALEGYESMYGRKPERIEKIITDLRERLGEKV